MSARTISIFHARAWGKKAWIARHTFRRWKGYVSTIHPSIAKTAPSAENGTLKDEVSNFEEDAQDIQKLVHDAIFESASAPTDERLDYLCHTLSSLPDLSIVHPIGQPCPGTHPHLLQPLEITPGITKMEYKERRKNLLRILASTAAGQSFDKHAVIITGSPMKIMSADIPYPFHQNSDFLYLSGFKEPDAVLILESKSKLPFPDHNVIMFVKPRDRKREIWDGPVSGLESAKEFFGASESYPINSLSSVLKQKYGNNSHCLWYNLSDNTTNPKLHNEIINLFNSETFSYPALHSLGHNVQMLRLIKSPAEIELMKKSAEIAGKAFSRVMLSTKAGLEESVLHAVLEYECKIQGAQLLAFPPVVASGLSTNTLHYISNSHLIRNGDLILMDAGCEYNGYVSDITRTWPVNGKFTKEQRQLYEVVLRVQNHCIENCRVGTSLDQLHQRMLTSLGTELQRIGLIDQDLTENSLKKAVAEYCPHHLGHYLGMDTHDTPLIHRGLPLQQGMVITVEPGLYIPSHYYHVPKRYRGIGIRIEDDILITNNGPFILSGNCPKTVDEIEQLLSLRSR